MEILNLSLPATNRFATEYLAQSQAIQHYFHYRYDNNVDYKNRLEELNERTFMRTELTHHIEQFMANFPTSDQVRESLEKLKMPNSTVVIGGQQAGILTGPLYTINKVLSIILLAKQKEAELHIPVVPVFWIAGEDHDYQEVNHVYIEKNNKIEKRIYPEKVHDKRMISDVPLDRELCKQWVEEIVQSFGETSYTKDLLQFLEEAIDQSKTVVDFFAFIIMYIFKDSGLLLIDSGDGKLRNLEKEFFLHQINSFEEITNKVKLQQEELKQNGFLNTIDISSNAVNLFYYDKLHHDRVLLEYDHTHSLFIGKEGHIQFTKEQLIEIASEFPEKLSNNVVTRPIMQEWLFPTLAFIAGPGEIAYWAELKQAFELFKLKMPPIVPRINLTFLDRSIETDLNELSLELIDTLTNGTEQAKREFLNSIKDDRLEMLFEKTKQELFQNYETIESYLQNNDRGIIPLLKKNEDRLMKEIMFMQERVEDSIRKKHEVVINKFDRVENALWPAGSPQERVLNGLYFINRYGPGLINDILACPLSFDGMHKVIKM